MTDGAHGERSNEAYLDLGNEEFVVQLLTSTGETAQPSYFKEDSCAEKVDDVHYGEMWSDNVRMFDDFVTLQMCRSVRQRRHLADFVDWERDLLEPRLSPELEEDVHEFA